MCLAVPGQVITWLRQDPPFAEALVEFAGARRRVNLSCTPEARPGDFVLVHAGIGITILDPTAAQETLRLLRATESDCRSEEHS